MIRDEINEKIFHQCDVSIKFDAKIYPYFYPFLTFLMKNNQVYVINNQPVKEFMKSFVICIILL